MDQAYIQDLVSVYSDFHIYMFMYYLGIAYLLFSSLEMARNFQNRGRELYLPGMYVLAEGSAFFSGRNIIKHRMRRRMARPTKMAV